MGLTQYPQMGRVSRRLTLRLFADRQGLASFWGLQVCAVGAQKLCGFYRCVFWGGVHT